MEFAYWCAHKRLRPYGDDWERSSMIASQIVNAIMSTAAGIGGGSIEESDLLDYDAFVPYRKPRDKKAEELKASLKELESLRGL